jgi:hypothetical protein
VNVIAFPYAAAVKPQQQVNESVILFKRKGVDVNGHAFEETIVQTPDNTLWLKVRSQDLEHCFDEVLSLPQVIEYMDEASAMPFVPTVIEGQKVTGWVNETRREPHGKRSGIAGKVSIRPPTEGFSA